MHVLMPSASAAHADAKNACVSSALRVSHAEASANPACAALASIGAKRASTSRRARSGAFSSGAPST